MSAATFVVIVNLALAIITVEVVVLLWRYHRSLPFDLLKNPLLLTALSGLGLLLALRAAADGADPLLALAALTFGGLAHIADMVARLRQGRGTTSG
jgi:hypothetical protein